MDPARVAVSGLALSRTGRDGVLHLRLARHGERTVLNYQHFRLPLQVLRPLPLAGGGLYLMLLNPCGGLVGGDRLTTAIELQAGAHAVLTTPAATKVYATRGAAAQTVTEITLGRGAILEYLPDHLIPHPGALLEQRLTLKMESGGRAILFDATAAGRIARGERWRFERISSETLIRLGDRPLYISRADIAPGQQPPAAAGLMAGFGYLGSVLAVGDGFAHWDEMARAMAEAAAACSVEAGASALAAHGAIVRILSNSADALGRAMAAAWTVARARLLDLPPFDLRKL
jgi:urease accessory protein